MRIRETLYFDHQATTPLDGRVFSAMAPYFAESFGNPHSVDHRLGWKAASAVEDAAASLAGLVGADADEIVFTSGATEANNLALLGLGRRASAGKRRRVLVSAIEHKSVLAVGRILHRQLGYQVDSVPVDAEGFVDVAALKRMLSDDVLVVSVMAVNNEIGTVQDIAALSEVITRSGALLHCDAAQAPCAIDIRNTSRLVDLLSLSGHKMYGPQGTGALFVRRDLQENIEPLIYGGSQQRGLRSGTMPVALCVGMGAAAALQHTSEARKEREALQQRTESFIHKLMDLPWPISLNGPEGAQRHPGNANIRFQDFDAHDILSTLQPHLAASTGSACTSGISEPSHVLRAIGLSNDEARSSIRFSIGRSTTDSDLGEAVKLIYESLSRLTQVRELHRH